MRDSRKRLVTRVLARLSADLFPHRVIAHILARTEYSAPVRRISAALARVELDQRSVFSRFVEYLYVLLRLPGYSRVTLGPSQLRLSLLRRAVAHCSCEYSLTDIPTMRHCLSLRHHASTLLLEIVVATAQDNLPRQIVNAHNKGAAADDLATPTVYSEVVLGVGEMYSRDRA
jgi:hypothetical protein